MNILVPSSNFPVIRLKLLVLAFVVISGGASLLSIKEITEL